jgi:hypothetical protein
MLAAETKPRAIMIGPSQRRAPKRRRHIGWYFQEKIADEEQARPSPVHGVAHPQVRVHLELGESDVDPVDEGQHVTAKKKGDKAPGDLR